MEKLRFDLASRQKLIKTQKNWETEYLMHFEVGLGLDLLGIPERIRIILSLYAKKQNFALVSVKFALRLA